MTDDEILRIWDAAIEEELREHGPLSPEVQRELQAIAKKQALLRAGLLPPYGPDLRR